MLTINIKRRKNNVIYILFLLCLIVLSKRTEAQLNYKPTYPIDEDLIFDQDFSDEFNEQILDENKWWDFNPAWHGRKPGFFDRENVVVKDGLLQLTARAQNPEEVTVENKVRGYDKFTTSCVKSKKRIKYGYFEVRCRSMEASVCNAFWLYDPLDAPAKYREGSFSEEIDIFEIFGKPTKKEYDRVYRTSVIRLYTPYVESIVNSKQLPLPKSTINQRLPFDFHTDFHIYAFLWTPTVMKWFVDGRVVFTRDNDYFNSALHIMFDSEIMELWAGLPNPMDLPSTFYIDYLRVWKLKDQPFPMAEGF